jgi:hypothetical protein
MKAHVCEESVNEKGRGSSSCSEGVKLVDRVGILRENG